MKIVEFSIRRPVTVTMFFVAIAVFGIVSYDQLALNLLPEISYPTLTIRTRLEAAAPAEIESLVSRPVENAVSVVNSVVRVSSVSKPETSDVIIEFSWNTQMDFAALDVREKLDLVQLPIEADKPILLRYDPSTDPIMRVSVTGSSNLAMIRYLCEEFIRPEIESIAGVAAVRVTGGLEEEIFVEVDEQKLASLGISISSLTNRMAEENINLTGGTLREGESRYLVRTLNEFQTVDEIDEIVIALRNGAPVRLKDVGDAYSGYKEREIITRINGEESVEIAVFKAADANTVSVAQQVRADLDRLEADYKGKRDPLDFEVVFDQSQFIKQSIDEVLNTALIGGILAVLVLLVFLRSFKSTLIIALSIPISIVATFFLMYTSNVSLNIMSLSGLALGIGMLVDNSIVVLESIYRYHSMGYTAREAADKGASEVGQAVVASTLTTVCVFAPIVFVEGVAGQLFADQALTVTFALGASLVVAIMLIPMLSSLGSKEGSAPTQSARPASRFFLVRPYLAVLNLALKARLVPIVLACGLFGGSLWMLSQLGAELIPEISQGEFLVDYQLPPGTALEETSERLKEVEQLVREVGGVETFYTIVGSGNQTGVSAVEEREHIGQTLVRLKPGLLHELEDQVVEEIRQKLVDLPALEYKYSRPTLFSFKTPIEVVVQGYNLNALKVHTERLKTEVASIDGLRDLKASTEGGNPEVHISFDRRRLATYGLNVSQAANLVRNKVQGEIPTEFNEGDRKIDIRVRVVEEDRRTIEALRNLALSLPDGSSVYLRSVAEVELREGPTEIRRIGPQRAAVITGTIAGRDLESVVQDIKSSLAAFPLPSDFIAFVSGQSEERSVAFESMQFAIMLAVFLVYLVMASQFESLVQPFVIMFAIPFALIGVALALYLTQQPLNVVVLIGTVILAGIVVNNSIVLIDYTNQVRHQGVNKFDAVREACSVRLRPILMTTSTTILGLLPMALNWGEGAELRVPLAVTIIGGLMMSTLLTLVLVPVLYTIIAREKQS
ncbi:MAG: efflux RND transporter permease subunit [Acidobacteriota bacterium]|nr:MAG: efflux RND transporter permease subunit [Acidobacteriota bacterium]